MNCSGNFARMVWNIRNWAKLQQFLVEETFKRKIFLQRVCRASITARFIQNMGCLQTKHLPL